MEERIISGANGAHLAGALDQDGLSMGQQYRLLFENMREGFAICRMHFLGGIPHDFTYLAVNHAFETLMGLNNVVGRRMSEVIPGILESNRELLEIYGRVTVTGVPERFESWSPHLRMWLSISVHRPCAGCFAAVFDDITERKQAQKALEERAYLASLGASVGAILSEAGTMAEGLQCSAEAFVHHLEAAFVRIWTLNELEGILELKASAGIYTHLNGPHGLIQVGHLKIGLIAQTGIPHLSNRLPDDPQTGDREWARREGMVGFAGYPLMVEGRVQGVIGAFRRTCFAEAALQTLSSVSVQLAQFIKRKRAEEALRISEARYRRLFEQSLLGIVRTTLDGEILEFNSAMVEMLGYSSGEEIAGQSASSFYFSPEERADLLAKARDSGAVKDYELRMLGKDGRSVWVLVNMNLVEGNAGAAPCLEGHLIDITERKLAEQQLSALNKALASQVAERTALLKEVHHRVKNNLQVISSLLKLQAREIHDPGARRAFEDSRLRVHSVSMVHEALYGSNDLARVDFAGYARNLVRHLFAAYGVESTRVALHLEVDSLGLPIDIAVPCALILSELAGNSFKYAFSGSRSGTLRIRFSKLGDCYLLEVADTGAGSGLGSDSTSFGLQLVSILVRQLNGTCEVTSGNGFRVSIQFPVSR